jgi:hypothetical protein
MPLDNLRFCAKGRIASTQDIAEPLPASTALFIGVMTSVFTWLELYGYQPSYRRES